MRRAVQKEIEDPLSEEILRGRFKGINKIKAVIEGDTLVFVEAESPALTGMN